MLALLAMGLWYPLVAHLFDPASAGIDLLRPAFLGQVFNSMAEHLLQFRFDVDPAAIGSEVFLVDGRAIAYFGPFCALLRIPLVLLSAWVPGLAKTDITWLSCLTAIWLGAWFQIRAVMLVRDASPPSPRRDWLTGALLVAILCGGQQIQFLRPSVYQEVIDWAGAEAMIFSYLTIRSLLTPRGFDTRSMMAMAACAGLALLTRVSFGAGLYAAMCAILISHWRITHWRIAPAAILLAFVIAAGIVNLGRWGNPLTFADFTRYSMNLDVTPDRLVRLAAYGNFNPARIWLGLAYYLLPLWAIVRPDGQFLWAEAQTRLIDAMELPPGALLLSDPVLIALGIVGVLAIRNQRPAGNLARGILPNGILSGGILAGLALPGLLMLCAISMTYRYRMEFYPLLIPAALLGFHRLASNPLPFGRPARFWIVAAVVTGVAVSHAQLALYVVSPWGPAEQYIVPDGWFGTYAPRLSPRQQGS